MTSITQLQRIVEHVRSLTSRDEKIEYLKSQDRDTLNFLGGNITKDGVAKTTASKIRSMELDESISDIEQIVGVFKTISKYSRKKDKIRELNTIFVTQEDRKFILTCLFGSLKLGVKIPIPDPIFGETIHPQLCGTGIDINPNKNIIEEKFDGIRCLASNNNGEIILQSRNGKILDVPIIKRSLKNVLPIGATTDGEIIATDGKFESLDRKSNNLIYRIFDIIFIDYKKIKYELVIRKETIYEYIRENEYVQISQELNLNSMEDIDNWIVKTGAEGIISKDPNSLYKYNDRKMWIKYKLFKECTATVIDYTEGEGRRSGGIGAINVIPENMTEITKVGSGFNDEQLIEMKQLIDDDKNITVNIKYQNLTNDGCLRFPIFLGIRSINNKESLEW